MANKPNVYAKELHAQGHTHTFKVLVGLHSKATSLERYMYKSSLIACDGRTCDQVPRQPQGATQTQVLPGGVHSAPDPLDFGIKVLRASIMRHMATAFSEAQMGRSRMPPMRWKASDPRHKSITESWNRILGSDIVARFTDVRWTTLDFVTFVWSKRFASIRAALEAEYGKVDRLWIQAKTPRQAGKGHRRDQKVDMIKKRIRSGASKAASSGTGPEF
jgi:hypothetical protein